MIRHTPPLAAAATILFGCAAVYAQLSLGNDAAVTPKATIYVAKSAVGSGDGSSCGNARAVSFFNAAANWGSGKAIAPGTTVGLCGTITSSLTVQGSGTAGSPVTILFMPGAKISQPVCGPCLTMSARSYVVVDGGSNGIIEATANGTGLANQTTSAGIRAKPCDHCEIKNLTIQNIYVHTGSGSEIDQTGVNAIDFNGSDVSIHNNTIHDAGWAVMFGDNGQTNVRIYDNNIYRVDHGLVPSFGTTGGSAGPYYVYGNHFHDFGNWDTSNNAYHHDGIHCYTVAGGKAQHISNFYIYDNRFDGDIGRNATAWVFLEGAPRGDSSDTPCSDASSHFWIFNNVFTSSPDSSSNPLLTLATGQLFIANNLIGGPDPTNTLYSCLGWTPATTATIYNNAIGGCNSLLNGGIPAALDNNAYAFCTGSFNCFNVGSTETGSWTTYRSQQPSLDTHSVADLSAATGSNAAGVGRNLSSMCTGDLTPLCSDLRGALRPLRMAPDAGPYQRETAKITAMSVGRVRLGIERKKIESFYGARSARRVERRAAAGPFVIPAGQSSIYRIHGGILKVVYVKDRVAAVSTTSRYYNTIRGFGVGAEAMVAELAAGGWRICGSSDVRVSGDAAMAVVVRGGVVTSVTLALPRYSRCKG